MDEDRKSQEIAHQRKDDLIKNLQEENTLLKHYNIDLRERVTELKDELGTTKKELRVKSNALNSLTHRKTIRIYRRMLRLVGKDVKF